MAYTRRSNGHAFKSGSQENLSPPPNFFLLPSHFLLFVGLHRQKFAAKPAFHQNKFLIICRSTPKSSNKVTTDQLGRLIYEVRGERVMLDSDLASIYGVETKALNRAVKRNRDRFPKDFMFQLSENEWENLRYQIGTASLRHGGRRSRPYAFTEHGAIMAANILNSRRARVSQNARLARRQARVGSKTRRA